MAREPQYPQLQQWVETLAQSACSLKWAGTCPLRNANGVAKPSALWDWFGIPETKSLSNWHLHDPADNYTPKLREVGEVLVAVLDGNVPPGKRADVIVVEGRNDAELRLDEALRLVHEIWEATEIDREILARARALARDVHRERVGLRQPTILAPDLAATLPIDATPLAVPPDLLEISTRGRRNLFLKPTSWKNICAGGYCRRPILEEKLIPECRRFLERAPALVADFQLPCFWIGGRSGDGKSILLMQLAEALLREPACPPLVHFANPDGFLAWLNDSRARQQLAGPELRLVAVIDDFHKATDWFRASAILSQAASDRPCLAIITCGPTPERTLFAQSGGNELSITGSDTKRLDDADWRAIAEHLEIDLINDDDRSTLVERVFFSLPDSSAHSLHSFADSLRTRVDGRLDRENLLEQLTLMTMLDLELPASYVGAASVEWLNTLSSETQLHINVSDSGYRFGHPAIAAPLFDSLTNRRDSHARLEHRIANSLSQVLPKYVSIIAIVRVLQQVQARLASRNDTDSQIVIQRLLDVATTPTIHRATAIAIINAHVIRKQPIDQRLKNLARTIRSDARADLPTKAHVTKQLAMAKNADWPDRLAALNALSDLDLAPLMGQFVFWLKSKDASHLLESFKPRILKWALQHPRDKRSQDILVTYLSRFSEDPDVRDAALELTEILHARELSISFIVSCAIYLESELNDIIQDWFFWRRESFSAAEVFATLLSKHSESWMPEAIAYLGGLDKNHEDFGIALSRLLPFLKYDGGIQSDINILAEGLAEKADAHGFFSNLATIGRGYDVEGHLDRRLRFLMAEDRNASSRREAYDLIAKAWKSIGNQYPQHVSTIFEIIDVVAVKHNQSLNSKVINAARQAVREIFGLGAHAQLYFDKACGYLDAQTEALLEGMVVGCFLNEEEQLTASSPRFGDEISRRRERFREIALRNARQEEGTDPHAQAKCSSALIRTMKAADMPLLRTIFQSGWRTLSWPGPLTLDAWLKNEVSRADALQVILSNESESGQTKQRKAKIVASNQLILFHQSSALHPVSQRKLFELFMDGISDYDSSPSAAWFALQNRDRWPRDGEKYIWAGVLNSALKGHTISLEVFWSDFVEWQLAAKDVHCRNIVYQSGLTIGTGKYLSRS